MNNSSLLVQSLQNPTIYPHDVEYFKIIETHISWVLLTGKYAYKIKKPLNLGFLDFSSLEKRRHYCFEEIRLNSRLAKDIYLEVVAISGSELQPQLNNSGTAIEYAVKMHQFEPDKTFDHLLARKQLTIEHIKQTAGIIATFHSNIKCATTNTKFGSADTVIQPVQENFSQILQLDRIEKPAVLNQLEEWCKQQHSKLVPLFNQRKKTGDIRECHGDLHLGNIALIDNKVVPFDGIEFNPFLYWIDTISEIAFLVMDLQEKQRQDLAFQFLNTYLQHCGDFAGLKLLRFYLVYRAMVRAKVSAIRASQSTTEDEHRQAVLNFQDYLQLASSYTQPPIPVMIIMYGVSGSGKSWLSEQIINRYQVIRIRSDVERKRLHNLTAQQKSYSDLNANLYNQTSSDKTYQHLLQLAVEITLAGYSVIVDATFLQQQQRTLFSQQAEQQQIPFLIVHTQTDNQTLLQRIKRRALDKDNVSEADQLVLEKQLKTMRPLNHEELNYSITVDTKKNENLSGLWQLLDKLHHSNLAS